MIGIILISKLDIFRSNISELEIICYCGIISSKVDHILFASSTTWLLRMNKYEEIANIFTFEMVTNALIKFTAKRRRSNRPHLAIETSKLVHGTAKPIRGYVNWRLFKRINTLADYIWTLLICWHILKK